MSDIDTSKKLEITFENQTPVLLDDLTGALFSVGQQYARFVEAATTEQYRASPDLFIKEVRTGSLVFEVVALGMPILPLVWQGGSLSEWVDVAKETFDWLLNRRNIPPVEMAKQDLQQWDSIIEPVAKDNGSQIIFNVTDNGKVTNNFIINSPDALIAQSSIRKLLADAKSPENQIYRRKVMTWYQTRFDSQSDTGDKVIIEAISRKATKVIFENPAVKAAMLQGDSRYDKPWNELAYVVDVKVQTVGGVPKLYEIVDYHSEHTFDPTE